MLNNTLLRVILIILIVLGIYLVWLLRPQAADKEAQPPTVEQVAPPDDASAVFFPRECGESNNNTYAKLDSDYKANLLRNYPELAEYENQGYRLADYCINPFEHTEMVLFDSSDRYWQAIRSGEYTEAELRQIEDQAVLGYIEHAALNAYEISIEPLRFEGTGATACNLDGTVEGFLLYICNDTNDSFQQFDWYAFDPETGENILVKHLRKYSSFADQTQYPPLEETYREDLYELFAFWLSLDDYLE